MPRKQLTFNPEWNNVPVQKIGLNQWLQDHPSEAAKEAKKLTQRAIDRTLNSTQDAHLRGELNIYEPVEAYSVSWYHKGDTYYPIPDTAKRNDLPPVYIQWKDDYRKRNARIKRNSNRNIQKR